MANCCTIAIKWYIDYFKKKFHLDNIFSCKICLLFALSLLCQQPESGEMTDLIRVKYHTKGKRFCIVLFFTKQGSYVHSVVLLALVIVYRGKRELTF